MATKVWVLTISAIGEDTHYEVYDKRSKAELAVKIHEDLYRVTEADFETLKSYAKGITADNLDDWLEEDLDDIGQLNSYALWSVKDLNDFLKENDYEIEGELECIDV